MTEASWTAGAAVERLRTVRAMILQEAAGAYIDREAAGDTRLAEALAMLREALGVRDIFGYSELNEAIRAAEAEARARDRDGPPGE